MSERFPENHNHSDLNYMLDSHTKLHGNLLQLQPEKTTISEFNDFVTPLNNMVIGSDGRFAYTSHLINPYDREHWWIPMDHCYARPWNWRPESTFLRPTKTLFMPKQNAAKRKNEDDIINVETEPEKATAIYDKNKAQHLMKECERYAFSARIDRLDNWEEGVIRENWNATQNRLFNGMVNILNSDHMARLAQTNTTNEPIRRRIVIDKSVERIRKLMATAAWDTKYTQWLHQLLIDHLNTQYLASYLDILQTLRSKLPSFIDKMISGTNLSRLSVLGSDNLSPLLKRPWDPVALSLMQDKPKKLPGSPIIVVVPSTPISSKRMLKWINLLSNLATVVTIPANYAGTAGHKSSMISCVDQMFVMTRNKIQDLRLDNPGRNIVLAGFGFGATLALQVAQVEQVQSVISLGFSLQTAEGKRGEPDDNLLELQCPVLFVVGQCSSTSLQEDMEDLRERMRVETGLIVVGSADNNLRVSKRKKKNEGITQSIVDRCIADEIGEFISGVILSPFPPQIRQSPTNLTTDPSATKKSKATERKRYNSNASSVDSEPPSPTPRITRPGQNNSPNLGRPPGSKSKKLDSKWAMQGTPLSPSQSPPPLRALGTPTPDTSSNDSILTPTNNTEQALPTKKIKTLKPQLPASEKIASLNTSVQTARALGLQNRPLSALLQTDFHSLVHTPQVKAGPSGIKVLENVKLGGLNSKFIANSGKMVDMSKISLINTKPTGGHSIVLLPDGKMKNFTTNSPRGTAASRYITSKRQLIGNKPPKPVKKVSYLPQPSLPPPTNLTTQDIMDLPIIFADDNQILSTALTQEVKPPTKFVSPNPGNKFMVINKPTTSNYIISNASTKSMTTSTKLTPKYTKIILSSKRSADEIKATSSIMSKISNLSPEISVKKVPAKFEAPPTEVIEELDLENAIAASTLYKPVGANVSRGIPKLQAMDEYDDQSPEAQMEKLFKRSADEAGIGGSGHEGTSSKLSKLLDD